MTTKKPYFILENNIPSTFIPNKPDTNVGIEKTIVTAAKNLITKFRLLDIIEA